jgi:hypothetical protein
VDAPRSVEGGFHPGTECHWRRAPDEVAGRRKGEACEGKENGRGGEGSQVVLRGGEGKERRTRRRGMMGNSKGRRKGQFKKQETAERFDMLGKRRVRRWSCGMLMRGGT